jgi:beta-lactam-binding protein with PASTA domain/predicted Ser/Thr protein kinase
MPEPTVFNGRYELHRRLGKGGMAEVFLARDLQLDRPVAVKVLFPEYANDPNFVARFRREAQAAANLNHPNIVGVFDWGQEHGTYFIVMEYVEGRSLADLIRTNGRVPATTAVDVATDIAAALGAAHRAGVLHRDIKPGNIMVTPAGMVKVADWGIGRALDASVEDNLTQTGAVMGTATYFSPEQAQGLPLDQGSDLYALGVVLYEMLTGRTPFTGDSPVSIAYKHVQEPPRPPRSINLDIPVELEAITMQLLEKKPADRYASADDLRADLRRYREGFRVHAMQRETGAAAVAGTAVATTASTAGTQVVPQVGATVSQHRVEEPGGPAYVAPPPERSGGWVFVVALVALLAVLAGLLYLLAQNFNVFEDDGEPDAVQIDIPTVEDLDRTTARQQLEALGFVVAEEAEQVQDPAQVDRVIRQNPQGGIRADQGSTVTITVGSQNTFAMPNLAGSTPDAARNTLSGLGFTGEVRETQEASETVDAGEIIGTDPAAGTQVATSSTITLQVSTGPPLVPVPSCNTLTESDCVNAVSAAGFTPEVVQQPDPDVDEGRVVRTEPAGATEAENGSIVRIIVSSGPGTTSVPPVVGLDEDAARGALDDAGFGVNVVDQPVTEGSADDGRVISQNPGGNTQAEPGSTVTIVVGRADVGD